LVRNLVEEKDNTESSTQFPRSNTTLNTRLVSYIRSANSGILSLNRRQYFAQILIPFTCWAVTVSLRLLMS